MEEDIPFRIITITACTHVGTPIMFYTLAHYLDLHRSRHPEIHNYNSHSGVRINAKTSLRTFYTYIGFILNLAPETSKDKIVVRIYELGSIHVCGMQRTEDAQVLEKSLKRIFRAAQQQPCEPLRMDLDRHLWMCEHQYIFGKPDHLIQHKGMVPIGHISSNAIGAADTVVMNGHIVRQVIPTDGEGGDTIYVANIKRRIEFDTLGQPRHHQPQNLLLSHDDSYDTYKGYFPIQGNLEQVGMMDSKWNWQFAMINGHTSAVRPNWKPFRDMYSGFKCLEMLKDYLQVEHRYLMTNFDPNSENIRVMIVWMQKTGKPLVTVSIAPNGAFTVYAAKSVEMLRMVTNYTTQILLEFLETVLSNHEKKSNVNHNVIQYI